MYNTLDVRLEAERTPANIVGKAVTGKDFFGRKAELEELTRAVRAQHVLMLAPRRVGKTSLMLALADHERGAGHLVPVYASVAAAASEGDFVRTVLDAAYDTPEGAAVRPGWFESWRQRRKFRIKKVEAVGAALELEPLEHPWQALADEAFRKLATSKRPWLLLIDELPNLVLTLAEQDPSGVRVRAFLHWFRTVRQHPVLGERLRFVLAGSIGLDAVAHRYQASAAINDLLDWRLGPFEPGLAEDFVTRLAESQGMLLLPGIAQHVLAETEWLIPFHLQVLLSELVRTKRSLNPTHEDVEAAVEATLAHKLYFATWVERLREVFGVADADIARRVLTACAQDPQGASASTLQAVLSRSLADERERGDKQRWLMDVLENDGYLVSIPAHAPERWRFRSALLRRYWQRRFA